MQDATNSHERKTESVWELQEIGRALRPLTVSAHSQPFSLQRVGAALLSKRKARENSVVAVINGGKDHLWEIGHDHIRYQTRSSSVRKTPGDERARVSFAKPERHEFTGGSYSSKNAEEEETDQDY
jgi:hypothetical protein